MIEIAKIPELREEKTCEYLKNGQCTLLNAECTKLNHETLYLMFFRAYIFNNLDELYYDNKLYERYGDNLFLMLKKFLDADVLEFGLMISEENRDLLARAFKVKDKIRNEITFNPSNKDLKNPLILMLPLMLKLEFSKLIVGIITLPEDEEGNKLFRPELEQNLEQITASFAVSDKKLPTKVFRELFLKNEGLEV